MKIEIQEDDLKLKIYDTKEFNAIEDDLVFINSSDKEKSALNILSAYLSNTKQVLYDENNQKIKSLLEKIDFANESFCMLLFTSGTTGNPIGAFKSKKNLDDEVEELAKLLQPYNPKKLISTVPFIHIYGVLTSLLLPLKLDITLFFKKHFLPRDLLSSIQANSIIVTTPLYIQALLRLEGEIDLSSCVFISSTALLDIKDAKKFIKKYSTNLIQLFGSTETGGIAYKKQSEELWKPINQVKIKVDKNSLLHVSSPFVSELLYENGFKNTQGTIQSFDYANIDGNKFRIIGRSSQIFKVGGKRFSTLHIEDILESQEGIIRACVRVVYDNSQFKNESLKIYLQTKEPIQMKKIQELLKEKIGKIKFPIEIAVVDKIPTTALGKKIIPL